MGDAPLFDVQPYQSERHPFLESPVSADRRRTQRQREQLARGVHPATGANVLEGSDLTCGDCVHAERVCAGNRSFWKCELHRLGMSASAASDIRKSWPACTLVQIDGAAT